MKIVRNRKGFTLVELLVVIGIIALLISILLPALSRARDQANTVVCASGERQLYNVIMNYAADYHGSIIPCRLQLVGSAGKAAEFDWCGPMFLGTEMKSNVGNWDTSQAGSSTTDRATSVAKLTQTLLRCPAADHSSDPQMSDYVKAKLDESGAYYGDYIYNQWMGYINFGATPGLVPDQQVIVPMRKVGQIPGNVIMLMESHKPNVIQQGSTWSVVKFPGSWQYKNYFTKDDDIFMVANLQSNHLAGGTSGSSGAVNTTSCPFLRIGTPHSKNKKMNVLCVDGRVVLVDPLKDFFTDTTNQASVRDYLWEAGDNFQASRPITGDPNWSRWAPGL
jgi:prepilin-type N-terminal cleavage/methylation domain-containing protein